MDWEKFYRLLNGMAETASKAEAAFRGGDKIGGMIFLLGHAEVFKALQRMVETYEKEFTEVDGPFDMKKTTIH